MPLLIELPNDPDTIAAAQEIALDALGEPPKVDATGTRAAWSVGSAAISTEQRDALKLVVREIVEYTSGDPRLLLHPIWVDAE